MWFYLVKICFAINIHCFSIRANRKDFLKENSSEGPGVAPGCGLAPLDHSRRRGKGLHTLDFQPLLLLDTHLSDSAALVYGSCKAMLKYIPFQELFLSIKCRVLVS